MPSSTSQWEESGVWCADEESGDDFNAIRLTSPPSPQVINSQAKHSGGSVDASGDVQIVDVKEVDSLQSYNRGRNSANKSRRSFKRKKSKCSSSSSVRIPGISRKRRSSSFSRIFNYNRKTAPDVVMRRSSFGIKRMPDRSKTVEVDDRDVMWPDPGMFKPKNQDTEKRNSQVKGRKRTKSTATCVTTCTSKSGGTFGMDSTLRRGFNFGRMARSDRGSENGNTISRSVTSRPSLASSIIRESQFYSGDQRSSRDASIFYVEEKAAYEYGETETLERSDGAKTDAMEKMVENINLRNFMVHDDKSRTKGIGFPWLIRQLSCLYATTVFFVLVCFLLLGLTIWLIQDSNNLRHNLHELKTLMNEFNDLRHGSDLTPLSDSANQTGI